MRCAITSAIVLHASMYALLRRPFLPLTPPLFFLVVLEV